VISRTGRGCSSYEMTRRSFIVADTFLQTVCSCVENKVQGLPKKAVPMLVDEESPSGKASEKGSESYRLVVGV